MGELFMVDTSMRLIIQLTTNTRHILSLVLLRCIPKLKKRMRTNYKLKINTLSVKCSSFEIRNYVKHYKLMYIISSNRF